jgi:hypothetical protein
MRLNSCLPTAAKFAVLVLVCTNLVSKKRTSPDSQHLWPDGIDEEQGMSSMEAG